MLFTALVALLPALVVADLGKPVRYSDGLGPHFVFGSKLPTHSSTTTNVGVPAQCSSYGSSYCTGGATMSAVNVTYSDCSLPWTFCRCSNAQNSLATMISQFGRLPVNLRDYVRYVLSFNGGESAFSSSQDMALFGDESTEQGLTVLIHEAGHDIDQGTSSSSAFASALAADSCVPDAYADTSTAEDFAQLNVVQLYIDLFGQAPNNDDESCMRNQLNIFTSNSRLNKQAMSLSTCDLSVRSRFNHGPRADGIIQGANIPKPTPIPGLSLKRSPRRGLRND